MHDPLIILYNKYGFNSKLIKTQVNGALYKAIMLYNGNIGLAVTPTPETNINLNTFSTPNFQDLEHRAILTAYYNSLLNYSNEYDNIIDITDIVSLKQYTNIVMIGYCKPIAHTLQQKGFKINIFDDDKKEKVLLPRELKEAYLQNCDCAVVTATTLINGSIINILKSATTQTAVCLYGPSSIMCDEMFEFQQIKYIFGSIFKNNDQQLLNMIAEGSGTPDFSKLMQKVCFQKSNSYNN